MRPPKVLSLGQCPMDRASLESFFQSNFNLEVVSANTANEALSQLFREKFVLILVNRLLDSDQSQGLDFIKSIVNPNDPSTPIMLISNFQEAQNKAIALGAVQGFGKAELNSSKVIQMISNILVEKTPN